MSTILKEADAALARAQKLIAENKLEDAAAQLDTAIGGFEAAGEPYGLVLALKLASETSRDLGELETALAQVRRAHSVLADTKPEAEQIADFATEVGSIYAQMNDLTKARIWYVQGLHGYESAGRLPETAHNLICLAGLDRAEEAEDKAQANLEAAYEIYQQLGDKPQMMQVRSAMAQGLLAEPKNEIALTYLQEVLQLAVEAGDYAVIAETHQLLALVKAQQGMATQAEAHLAFAADYYTRAGDTEQAGFIRQLLESSEGK
ncbi:MAG: hypothetical protein Q3965_03780 [Rothia sp. (in: high G+C Gram-positive bacteria)]|nr:hypothetical protein [Rothia sp. (in: high G+C Gram-positive bacteria)]